MSGSEIPLTSQFPGLRTEVFDVCWPHSSPYLRYRTRGYSGVTIVADVSVYLLASINLFSHAGDIVAFGSGELEPHDTTAGVIGQADVVGAALVIQGCGLQVRTGWYQPNLMCLITLTMLPLVPLSYSCTHLALRLVVLHSVTDD